MSTLRLIIILLIHLSAFESSIFNCGTNSLCSSVNNCASNEACFIVCDGNHVCENKTFHCPSNGKCIIQCGTNISQKYSCHRTLFTTKSDTKIINITTQGINSMEYSTTFCPSSSNNIHGFSNNCFIYALDGQSQLSNINIYAVESYNDIYIQCKNRNCYDSSHLPTIYCSDYSSSCDIELQNQSTEYNIWKCAANTAFSICNSISFINNSTSNATISIQTTGIWTNIFDNVEAVENNSSDLPVIIGGILGAITCCLFIFIFVMATHLKINMRKSTSKQKVCVIAIDINKKELERLGSKSASSVISPTTISDSSNSRFINKRRASNLPKPKPRNGHHKMKQHAKEKQTYVITPTPNTIKNDSSDIDICDFSS
eukprot:479500_1